MAPHAAGRATPTPDRDLARDPKAAGGEREPSAADEAREERHPPIPEDDASVGRFLGGVARVGGDLHRERRVTGATAPWECIVGYSSWIRVHVVTRESCVFCIHYRRREPAGVASAGHVGQGPRDFTLTEDFSASHALP